jgi:ABC-type transport system substrate-binding protein
MLPFRKVLGRKILGRKILGRKTLSRLLALGAMCLPLAAPASAQTLTMATQSTFGIDPHFFFNGPNMAAARHIYDTVISRDENSRQVPGAVESWRAVETTIWELKLRPGVTFHDGTPFTAEDIAFSIARIPNVPGNIGPYTINLRTILRLHENPQVPPCQAPRAGFYRSHDPTRLPGQRIAARPD